MASLELAVRILAVDHTSKATRSALRHLQGFSEEVLKNSAKTRSAFQLSADLTHTAQGLAQFTQQTRALTETPLRISAQFEAAMDAVQAKILSSSQNVQEDMAKLTGLARQMGADTRYSAIEAAQALDFLAMAGYSADMQMSTLPTTLSLATAAGTDLATTADLVTNIMGGFALDASQTAQAADMLTQGFTSSNVTLRELGETMKMVGPAAHTAGWDLAQMVAMAGMLGDVGIKGTMAGTTLRSMVLRLSSPQGPGQKELKRLGVTPTEGGQLLAPDQLLVELASAMEKKGLHGASRMASLKKIFGEEPLSGVAALLDKAQGGSLSLGTQELLTSQGMAPAASQSSKSLSQFIATLRTADGVTKKVAETMDQNVVGSSKALQSAVQDLQIELGNALLPTLQALLPDVRAIVQQMQAFAKEHPTLIRYLGLAAMALAGLGTVLVPTLLAVSSLTTAVGVIRGAFSWTKTAVTTASAALRTFSASVKSHTLATRAHATANTASLGATAKLTRGTMGLEVAMVGLFYIIEKEMDWIRSSMAGINALTKQGQASTAEVVENVYKNQEFLKGLTDQELNEREQKTRGLREGLWSTTYATKTYDEGVLGSLEKLADKLHGYDKTHYTQEVEMPTPRQQLLDELERRRQGGVQDKEARKHTESRGGRPEAKVKIEIDSRGRLQVRELETYDLEAEVDLGLWMEGV